MKRKDFISRIMYFMLWVLLAFLSVFLGRKATVNDRCSSCPEYAGCNKDYSKCSFNKPERKG